jgi:hypothetical protein
MKIKKLGYGLVVVLSLLAGIGGGLALGQRGDDETTNTEAAGSAEKGGDTRNLAPPFLNDERTLYADEKNVKSQHVVRAGRFELADKKGNVRAVLGLDPDGEPRLALADESGQILATVGLEMDYNAPKNKLPRVRFLDRTGRPRTEIGLNRMGDPVILLKNPRGGTVFSLTGTDKTGTELLLMDEMGRPRIIQNINRNGTTMSFIDEGGKMRAGLGLKPDGNPGLIFSDVNMKNRVMLGYADSMITDKKSNETKTVSSLALFDKEGKVLWKAP